MGAWKHRIITAPLGGFICVCGSETVWHSGRWACRAKKDENRRGKHGLTRKERDDFLRGKTCAICGTPDGLVVDHCHETGRLRGALCNRHNTGLGMFQDDREHLARAIEYLRD